MVLKPTEHFEKMPIKKIPHTFASVTFDGAGSFAGGPVTAKSGYTPISAIIGNYTSPAGGAIAACLYKSGVTTYNLYISGKQSSTATNIQVDVIYVPNEWITIETS